MARNTLLSPIEAALAKAPSFGLPDTFQQSQEGRQQAVVDPGNVPFQADFSSASQKYGVPVNVLMALAQQESSFNPTALGQPTKWGRAKGLMQYLDSTAAGMGINPYDPRQAIDAAAKQLKQRLDKGYSVQEAIQAHFGGDDRAQWGPKTRQYGVDVLNRAQKFFDGTQGQIKQPQQQTERDFATEYPAAQSAMENMDQSGLRARAIATQSALDQLNADEPGRYRPLTATEEAQFQQQQGGDLNDKASQFQQDVNAATQPDQVSIPDHMAQEEQNQQIQQQKTQGIMDTALEAGSDVMNLLKSGVNIAAEDTKELVSRIPLIGKPIVNAADRFDRWANGKGSEELFKEWDKSTEKAFSPELAAARKKAWVVEPGDDTGGGKKATGYSFGPAWSDPRAYMSGILESLPEMAITMGGSGRLASMAYKGALARGATREAAAAAAARTATVAGGILEGGLGGASAARETREQISKMTPDQLKDSQALKALMDGGKSFEQARSELAENAASKSFLLAGVGTGLFGGMGDRAMAKIITSKAGRLKSALSGAIGEGLLEEAPQSALQQMGQNYAMQEADPNTPLMKGVANQVAGGAVTGGLMGAGMGFAAPHVGDTQPVDQQNPEIEPSAQPQPAPDMQAQDEATAAAPTPPRDDSGLSDDAGPVERALRGTADQPTDANGNLWAGEPGAAINMQAKGDPSTAMNVVIERYENDGSVTVRDEGGTPYTVTPEDVDVFAGQAQPAEAAPQEVTQPEATPMPEEQQAAQAQQAEEQGMVVDPETGEIIEGKPAVREIEAQQDRPLDEMSEEELRDRMRYIAQQAKQNGGMDKRLMDARRQVEKVLNAKIKQAETSAQPGQQPSAEVATASQSDNATPVQESARGAESTGQPESRSEPAGSDIVGRTESGMGENLSPKTASAEQNTALTGADGKPKWFASAEKAQNHINKRGLDGYQVVEVKPKRFEIHQSGAHTNDGATDATVPDSVLSSFPDSIVDDNGLISLNQFTPAEADALRATGLATMSNSEDGGTYEGVDPERLWPLRQARSKEIAKSRKPISEEEKQAGREKRAKNYERMAQKQESLGELGDQERAKEWRQKANDIRSGSKREAPKLPKAKKESPRINRARKVVGAEGSVVSPSSDVGYLKAGGRYKIQGIDKNGTIHVINQETGGGTTVSVAEMESARSRNVTWNKRPGTAVAPEQTRADVMREMEQDDNADALQRLNDDVQNGKISPTDAQKITDRAIIAAKKERDRSVVGDYIDEARERITGEYKWSKPENASTIELAETGNRVSIAKAGPLDVSALGTPKQPAIEAVAESAPAQRNEQQNIPENIPETNEAQQEAANLRENQNSSTENIRENAETSTRPTDYGANNKLVSQDRAAELRKQLKAKFSQLNSGIDPEILSIGTQLAVFHIEAGVRKFADFAKAMAADLDLPVSRVRPYLRSWYNGSRDLMEDSGVSVEGMDAAETVRSELAKIPTEEPHSTTSQATPPAQPQAAAPQSNTRQANARQTGALDDMVSQFDNEVPNVSNPRTGMELNSPTAGNAELVNEGANGNEPGRNGQRAGATSERTGAERDAGQRNQRVSDNGAATGREPGNQRVHTEDGQFRPSQSVTGGDLSTRSAGVSEEGLSVERNRAKAVADNAHAAGANDFNQRLAAQKKAPKETRWGNAESVRASLPMLLPPQQDDVVKVEQRHQKDNGIVVTNGTGTGKSFVALGVIKRFLNAGMDNSLLVVPSDKIASDFLKAAQWFDIPLKQLSGIKDNGGSGPVITTYANMGQNTELAKREWDLVIPDESHRLMQNEAGDITDQLRMFRAVTGHPDGFSTWMQSKYSDQYAKLKEAQLARETDATKGDNSPAADKRENDYLAQLAKWNELYSAERVKWQGRWEKQEGLPKAVFMSATPFAYVMNTDYAEGFLFHHTPPADRYKDRSGGGYNNANARDSFYVQHFGYRMRYNRLTRPDVEVNTELMEQNFNQYLKDTGALIGRSLDVPFDYDRKFILIDDAAGKKLDQALEYLNNGDNGQYRNIYTAVMETFDHQRKMFLLESMKARAAVPIIKQHLALGRKVLVVHDYNQGGGFNPFAEALKDMDPALRPIARELFQRPVFRINFSGLESALTTLTKAFPGALTFNGTVPKKKRRANSDLFNDDQTGPNVLIAQSDAMREGVSVHDTSGKHQRVEINLGLPTQPTKAIQLEGRIYRTGQASDAIFRYMTTGTAWEASAFASKLAERASTAENLAMGPDSRALKQSFIDSYQDAAPITASKEDGKGGKTADKRASNQISEFDKAKTYYFAQQKNNKSRDQREGADYYATPEPVGMKMVEWANIKPGDKVLEPSAGHGAIARFFPTQTDVTMVEPSLNLSQRAALANGNARIVNSRFEDLNRTNKYDAIVMNPPYGMGGKTAYEHVTKAVQHLREGGRIVALVPRGGLADRSLVDFMAMAEENGVHLVADIAMPKSTFERAGTQVNTRVLVLEKNTSEDYQAPQAQVEDLSKAESINELFYQIEDVIVSERESRQQFNDLPSFRMGTTANELSTQLKSDYPGLKLSLTGSGNIATLGRIELPTDSRNIGTGTQIMQRITAWADANGKTVALSPSSDFGGNKSRLNEFYKRFGFVENKGRNKDYEISETMYREPQEQNLQAWDRITSGMRQASSSDLKEMNRLRREGLTQAKNADRFGELIKRIEQQNLTATSNPERVLATLRAAEISGEYSKEGAQLAQWMIRQYPRLATTLSMDLQRGSEGTPAGNYNVPSRLVTLFSDYVAQNGEAVSSTDVITAVHEIMHHTERMLPRDVQEAISNEWLMAVQARLAEYNAVGDTERASLLGNLVAGMFGDRQALAGARAALESGVLPNSDYQYASPSEYWAENGARIIAERKAAGDKSANRTWVDKAIDAMRAIFNRIRTILGMKKDEPLSEVEKALDSVLAGDGQYQNNDILNRVGDQLFNLRDNFAGDYQPGDLPSMRSGMDPNPDIPTPEQDNARVRSWWDGLKKLPSDKLTDAMKQGLGAIPLHPLVNELGKNMPAAREFINIKRAMDTMRNKWHNKTGTVVNDWRKFAAKNSDANEQMMDLMHDSTIAQVDPSEKFEPMMTPRDHDALKTAAAGSRESDDLLKKAADDNRRRQDWETLHQRYQKLPAEAQKMFKTVRDSYTSMADEFERVLVANMEKAIGIRIRKAEREHRDELRRVKDEGLKGAERDEAIADADKKLKIAKTKTAWNRKARITEFRKQFESNRLGGPYFPLTRFGDFFVTVRNKTTGEVESFSRFEKAADQRKFAAQMKQNKNYEVEVGTLDSVSSTRKAVDANFVADVEDILADLPNADGIKDQVWQRYLESMPDMSIRKNRIHRKGRKGYSGDALRAFANQMFHGSHQLARLAHTFDMEESLDAAREQSKRTSDPVRDGLVVNEMERRFQFIMNPTGSPLAQALSSAAFTFMLAASPASAAVNLSQSVIIGIPKLAAFEGSWGKGFTRANNQLIRAFKDLAMGKGSVTNYNKLTDDERKAIEAAYDSGLTEKTQSHDVAGVGEGDTAYKPIRESIMRKMSFLFHHTERINREITFLAAYRMARAKGMSHQAAVSKASDLTWDIHYDYQNTSRPRWMQGNAAKVLLVFRNYTVNSLYLLFRNMHQSLAGESAETKKEARIQLAGITGMLMLNAGITGVWGYGILMMLAGMFSDDDKDPQEEVKKWVVEALGPTMGGIVLDGIPGYLTGTAISDRIGMKDLWFRSPNSELEGKGEFEYWQSQMLGAVPSIGQNAFRGLQLIKDGQIYRGIETSMPAFIKNPMKAYRYATEGATNTKGDTIVEDVGWGDITKQALGFTPAKLAEQYDLNNAGYNMQSKILKTRQNLMNDYYKAFKKDDEEGQSKAIDKISDFNAKYPEQAITNKSIKSSMKTRAKNAESATGGMRYNNKLRERILEEQAPRIYD